MLQVYLCYLEKAITCIEETARFCLCIIPSALLRADWFQPWYSESSEQNVTVGLRKKNK